MWLLRFWFESEFIKRFARVLRCVCERFNIFDSCGCVCGFFCFLFFFCFCFVFLVCFCFVLFCFSYFYLFFLFFSFLFSFFFVKAQMYVLTGGNWQKWKRVFLTCPCHEIYRDEAVGLKSCKNTWKITIFVKMWNLGQYRENLIFCQ